MPRALLVNLAQESCSFAPRPHELADFRRYYLLYDDDVIPMLRGGQMEVAGVVAVAEAEGVELVPTVATYGGTGGPVSAEAYAFLREAVLARVARHAGAVDGALLALHGAMVVEGLDDAEGDLIGAVRALLGPDKPLVVSLDLHAHITEAMLAGADAIVGYHTFPHVDLYDTGARAMRLLAGALRGGVRPVLGHRKLPMITPAERHRVDQFPMSEVMGRALAMEAEPGVLAATIFAVQPWLDVPHLGWSAVVVADGDRALAQAKAEEIADIAWRLRREFLHERTPVAEALRRAREIEGGPVVLADSSDATSGGAEGDSTVLLAALLATPVPGQALLLLTDPEAVAACIAAGVRGEVTLPVGGKLATEFFRPVTVTGRVRLLSDGLFTMKSPTLPADRGRTAVLQVGEIQIVLSEKPVYTWDEECYRSVGLFPREAKLVQVKSPGGFRAVYEPFARAIFELDAPGPTDSNLRRLPYKRVTRPLFPLDEM
ncbi:MAG: M81 family metallopeptidase [Chloroflexota bacterium]